MTDRGGGRPSESWSPVSRCCVMGNARGVLVAAARRLGISSADYAQRVVAGEKWCVGCKDWHDIERFGSDSSRSDGRAAICQEVRARMSRRRYVPVESPGPFGPPPAPERDDDKRQARRRINVLVRTGRLPRPNALSCADCGHVWRLGERRHEYAHLSYAAGDHLKVEAVCSICRRSHRARD